MGFPPPLQGRRWPSVVGAAMLLALSVRSEVVAAERVLALAPHIVEILYAVGAGEQIVGAVRFSDYPPQAADLPRIGSYRDIAVEGALRLRPTLVVAMDDQVSGVDRLTAMGLRVEYSHPTSVEGMLADVLRLGAMVGREPASKALVASLGARLQELRARRQKKPTRVFYEIWHDPLVTAGGPSFITSALREIGAENVFSHVPIDSPRVSTEAVLRAAPDAVILPGEGGDVDEREAQWRLWFVDAPDLVVVSTAHDLLHRPGPRLIDGMEQLQRNLFASRHTAATMR